ncbi:hypothetical protein AB0D11_32530 [Streptomyces monashensis]|uniref:hypothetical protein n=1 Tax=Streptomyces monashensis TaxID=1678012 RepID=UPI0033ECD6DC
MKTIGRTSQNSSPRAVAAVDPVALSAGYLPVIAAATGVPPRGSLSRASTHVTTVFGGVISTLAPALWPTRHIVSRPLHPARPPGAREG